MCLAKAYLKKDSDSELLLENVASVEILDKKLILTTIFSETKEIEANIRKINFADSNIIVERLSKN